MPSVGHVAVGMAVGRGLAPSWRDRWRWIIGLAAVSSVADLDLVMLFTRIPSNTIWGHRGFTHSLLVGALVAGGFALVARRWGARPGRAWTIAFLVYASHLLLDSMNVGTLGVPWLWPFTDAYYRLPWRPIPSVLTAREFLTWRGVPVLLAELAIFSPAFVYGLWGMFRRRGSRRSDAAPSPGWRQRGRVEGRVE